MDDPVSHPAHYTQYEHEVIELTEQLDFCLGNAVKYILRAPFKGKKLEDLKKARWYVARALETPCSVVSEEVCEFAESYGCELLDELLRYFLCEENKMGCGETALEIMNEAIAEAEQEAEMETLKAENAKLHEEVNRLKFKCAWKETQSAKRREDGQWWWESQPGDWPERNVVTLIGVR